MKPPQIRLALSVYMAILFSGMIFAASCSSPEQENPSGKKTAADSSSLKRKPSEEMPQVNTAQTPEITPDKTDNTTHISQPAEEVHVSVTETQAKQREPIFEGWPKPAVALFISGRQHGYIEPCGCTGLENQKGGLARRKSLMRQLEDKGWPLVPLDVGNQIRRFGMQPVIKFETTMAGLNAMKYAAIGFGPDDLRLPNNDLLRMIAASDTPPPFVSANVVVLDPSYVKSFWIVESGGKKIGVTSILGKGKQENLASEDIKLKSPEDGLKDVWPKLKEQACDLYVLLAHASLDETRELVQKFPDFDLVITAGGAGEPTLEPEKIANTKTQMIQVGTKGMYVGVVGIFDDKKTPMRYQRVPLDDRFGV